MNGQLVRESVRDGLGRSKALLLAATLFVAFACAMLIPNAAQAQVSYVKVDGNYIYGTESYQTITPVSGFTYDGATNTLTISGTNASPTNWNAIYISGLQTDTVKIVTKGTNILNATESGQSGIYSETKLAFSGSGITLNNFSMAIYGYQLTFNSGTYRVNKSTSTAISGKMGVKIAKAAAMYVTTDTPSSRAAIYSSSGMISNYPSSLKSIGGYLSNGAKFSKGGAVYQLFEGNYYLRLVSWNGGKKANVDKVKYGGYDYRVRQIGAGAFKTAKGKKVKTIILGSMINKIGKNAFKGTKSLVNLNIKNWYSNLLYGSGMSIAKKAFAGCGKAKGKKLKVHTGVASSKYSTTNTKVKKKLVKKGLPKKAKVVK